MPNVKRKFDFDTIPCMPPQVRKENSEPHQKKSQLTMKSYKKIEALGCNMKSDDAQPVSKPIGRFWAMTPMTFAPH